MKILIPPKKETPNLISTLLEEILLEDSRIQSQQQFVAFSKLLIEQSGKLREDSKPTEEENLQLENLRNTLNSQWKEKKNKIQKKKIDFCYTEITALVLMMIICASDTVSVFQTQVIHYSWYSFVIIMEILLSLVVVYTLLKLCRQIRTTNQLDVENCTEKQISSGNMELSYTEQLEKCVNFYSKEVMSLKEGAVELENYASRLIKISLTIFILNAVALTVYCIIVAFKLLDKESVETLILLLWVPFFFAIDLIIVVVLFDKCILQGD